MQLLGKDIIGSTKKLSATDTKAQVVGSITSWRQIKHLPIIDPNDFPKTYPATTAYPEGRRLQFSNFFQLDTGHVGEESLEGVGSRFSPGAVIKYTRNFWYVLIQLQQQQLEALEYSEEVEVSHPSSSQP